MQFKRIINIHQHHSFISQSAFVGEICGFRPNGFDLGNRWQLNVTATEAGLIYCVEPIITSVLALFLPDLISIWTGINYPNETLTTRLLIGGGLVTAANILLQKRSSKDMS